MSHHSRSSSEVDTTTFRDILPIFLKDFFKDFCFHDVSNKVKSLFSEEHMRIILAEVDEKKQIMQLFWILYDNERYIEDFLLIIQPWYYWLRDKISDEQKAQSKDTERYIHAVRALRSDFQKHLDFNVHRMEYYWPIRMALKKLKPYNYLVVSGELGAGKKWLIIDVCSEYSIMKAMGFKIFWLDVHNCTNREDDFRSLQQFQLLIGEGDSTSTWRPSTEFDGVDNKVLHLQQSIRDRLQQDEFKDCLLILSDVQNSKTWKAFNLGCKVLIITRNKGIANSLSKTTTEHISIESGLTRTEFYQLFEKVLRSDRKTFPQNVTDIFFQSSGHPYLLSIIANSLYQSKQQNWAELIQNLQNLNITYANFTKIVEISLKVLTPSQMELYKTLTIFPHSFKIPLKVVAALWGKDEHETKAIIAKFDKYSIINRQYLPDESVACVLPYIYSSYLNTYQDIDRISFHKKVVSYYRVTEALTQRRDVDLFALGNDYYFYHCIGYHLSQSKKLDLFPKLFLDFGFLEKKLRSDGVPNTIGDLKYYRKEITSNDPYKNNLFSELLEFLPSIEEMLFRSRDACLLQYALMADGLVKEEAEKQAGQFKDKIWFTEKGHFHQRRQMVCLPSKPKLIKLPEPDTCVIVLDNNEILLADISLDYNNGPVYLTGNQYPISKIELILNDNYIVTLDVVGHLKVWSITDDRRRSASRKRSSRTKVNPLNLTQSPEMLKRKYKQLIQKSVNGAVQTFYIESFNNGAINLHLAFANGDICIYSWDPQRKEFEISQPMLPTKVPKIVYLSKILDKYYLILSNSGKMYIYNLRDSSPTAYSFDWPQPQNMVYIGEYERKIYFVCRDKVLCLTFAQSNFEFLKDDLETIYNINDNDSGNEFICARLAPDGCYLVMGSKHGVIVFNTAHKSEVLRGNVSECIACVDICLLDDSVFKYIIVCGSKHSKVLNLFALRQLENNTIAWSHRLSTMAGANSSDDSNDPQFEPDVWLQGKKLFDLNYSDSVLLVAADSKNRIHQLCTTNANNRSISLPPETSRKITAITAYNNTSFCAYENGVIFNITNEVFQKPFTDKSITFLQMINENTLVASSESSNKSLVRRTDDGGKIVENEFNIVVVKCFTLFDSYLILVDAEGSFVIVDLKNELNEFLRNERDLPSQYSSPFLGGCDLKNNRLLLVTTNFNIFIYIFSIRNGKLHIQRPEYPNRDHTRESDKVTCVTCSSDASLFAVGLKSGKIEVYQMVQSKDKNKEIKFVSSLTSHRSMIYDLKFSPNAEILVSCSEQLCFWHVEYIINNPFESGTKQKRRSSRFTSSHSPVEEVTNAFGQLNQSEYDKVNWLPNPWSNKRGSMEKPELLSCIKFVGDKAEIFYANDDFTQFNTIDNEGVYYHLCVHDISRKVNGNVTNGNGHLMKADGDDDVIT